MRISTKNNRITWGIEKPQKWKRFFYWNHKLFQDWLKLSQINLRQNSWIFSAFIAFNLGRIKKAREEKIGNLNLIKSGLWWYQNNYLSCFLVLRCQRKEKTTRKKKNFFITFVMRDFNVKNHFAVGGGESDEINKLYSPSLDFGLTSVWSL